MHKRLAQEEAYAYLIDKKEAVWGAVQDHQPARRRLRAAEFYKMTGQLPPQDEPAEDEYPAEWEDGLEEPFAGESYVLD